MGIIIAIAGKGGTGKTTICGLIINWLKNQKKGSILAVDADPNSNLAETLGLNQKETIGAIIDDIVKNPNQIPAGMSKSQYIEYRIQTTLTESDGIDLVSMGRPEGAGCYCYANNALRGTIEKLIKNYDFIIIDNEAGMEHLSRRTTKKADFLIIVSNFNMVGLRSAKRIFNLAKELDIKIGKSFLLINRLSTKLDSLEKEIQEIGLESLGAVPEDQDILDLSIEGKPITELKKDSKALKEIERIGKILFQ